MITDKMSLICKSSRFWVYASKIESRITYVLTLPMRRDCWLMIENVYPDGSVNRHFRFCKPKYFDFKSGCWFTHNPYSDVPCPDYVC